MSSTRLEGLDTLKLNTEQHRTIAQFLEDRSKRDERRRARRRFRFTNPDGLLLAVIHPGGSMASYRVMPRDLSELGLGFLHGNFLYPGSACRLDLRDKDGKARPIRAKIVRCDHITGRIHDIGIAFDQPIDVSLFLDLDEVQELVVEKPRSERPSYWRKA